VGNSGMTKTTLKNHTVWHHPSIKLTATKKPKDQQAQLSQHLSTAMYGQPTPHTVPFP